MTAEEAKEYKLVVIVTCQGQPTYYFYKKPLKAIVRFAYEYFKKAKYGTMNFTIKDAYLITKPIYDWEIKTR